MTRHGLAALAAIVTLGVGIGLVDPYACVQLASSGALKRPIPRRARAKLERTAARALSLVPGPPAPYVRQGDLVGDAVSDEKAAWDDASGAWRRPGAARTGATWVWEPPGDGDPESAAPPDLEVRVYVNSETGLPASLERIGDSPRLLSMDGATAVEVTTVDAAERGGRATAPITPEQAAHAVTVIRVVVAGALMERALQALVEGRRPLPVVRRPVAEAGRIESITVELYGGKSDVEALAGEIPVGSVRALLDP